MHNPDFLTVKIVNQRGVRAYPSISTDWNENCLRSPEKPNCNKLVGGLIPCHWNSGDQVDNHDILEISKLQIKHVHI